MCRVCSSLLLESSFLRALNSSCRQLFGLPILAPPPFAAAGLDTVGVGEGAGEGVGAAEEAGVDMTIDAGAAYPFEPRVRTSSSVICDLIASLSVSAFADVNWNV